MGREERNRGEDKGKSKSGGHVRKTPQPTTSPLRSCKKTYKRGRGVYTTLFAMVLFSIVLLTMALKNHWQEGAMLTALQQEVDALKAQLEARQLEDDEMNANDWREEYKKGKQEYEAQEREHEAQEKVILLHRLIELLKLLYVCLCACLCAKEKAEKLLIVGGLLVLSFLVAGYGY